MTRPLRVVGIADTDSYVKWGAALLGSRPDAIDARMLVLETPLVVSAAQQSAALTGSGLDSRRVRRVAYDALAGALSRRQPDAVLLAARGPLVRVLARLVAAAVPSAVIVTGLPGISIPATRKALLYRTQCDLFVLHSHREVREFGELAVEKGFEQRFALSRLPFAQIGSGPTSGARSTDLVFAAQAVVPLERADRTRIARMLVAAATADPSRRVVVKVRAVKGESQTHAERDGYPELLGELGALPSNLVISRGPMARALDTAEGLVTVSSTAAIEAVARRIPVIALDTFGVEADLINTVFRESGLFAHEDAVIDRAFRHPEPSWLRDNYFHDPGDDDWIGALDESVALRRSGALQRHPPLVRRGGRLRDAWERKQVLGRLDRSAVGCFALVVGTPLVRVARLAAHHPPPAEPAIPTPIRPALQRSVR
ncbi:DUF6716 putative glycosyltransferase [Micromonospora sp. DT81.3]|uniref:DUF6716 putative glycosyltransferase n=1 Tax=Micromonospora sp. DT81.3 TaxID=3416523 RepID=UPI003CE70EF9